ncbi:MAG: hypothetical protein HC850_02420 [Rhodomicrobium sp.]|nr:hypothetical protein [Rhodomicrobium sp.]
MRLFFVDILVPIAWPLVAIAAIIAFRKYIGDFAKRLVKAGPGGIEAAPPKQSAEAVNKSTEKSLDPRPDVPLLEPWEPLIRADVVHLKEAGVTDDELERRLVRKLAVAQQRVAYETISRQIYGTQIALLKHLQDGQIKTRHDLQDLYDEHELRAIGYGDTSFDAWIGFMLDLDLVHAVGNGYQISEHGQRYLGFVRHIGLSENRLF